MSLERIAQDRIKEAMEQGAFDDLPGAGKPLDLDDYFSTPEELRMAYSILKSAHCAPMEVELMNEVNRLEQAVAAASDPATRESLQRTLALRQTHLAVAMERRTHRAK